MDENILLKIINLMKNIMKIIMDKQKRGLKNPLLFFDKIFNQFC